MKKLSELDKNEKISLLKSIASNEIEAKDLTKDSLVVTFEKDWFMGLLVSVSQVSGEILPVAFIGEAKKAMNKFIENIK